MTDEERKFVETIERTVSYAETYSTLDVVKPLLTILRAQEKRIEQLKVNDDIVSLALSYSGKTVNAFRTQRDANRKFVKQRRLHWENVRHEATSGSGIRQADEMFEELDLIIAELARPTEVSE